MLTGPGKGPLSGVRLEPYVSTFSSKSHQTRSDFAGICRNLSKSARICKDLQGSNKIIPIRPGAYSVSWEIESNIGKCFFIPLRASLAWICLYGLDRDEKTLAG